MDERSEGGARSAEDAYMYNDGMKFRVKNYARVGNVLEIRVKATVRKNGVIVSWFPAEYYDEKQGEWKKVKGRHEVNIASLRANAVATLRHFSERQRREGEGRRPEP